MRLSLQFQQKESCSGGQACVALSRVRTQEGLSIQNLDCARLSSQGLEEAIEEIERMLIHLVTHTQMTNLASSWPIRHSS